MLASGLQMHMHVEKISLEFFKLSQPHKQGKTKVITAATGTTLSKYMAPQTVSINGRAKAGRDNSSTIKSVISTSSHCREVYTR